MTVDLSNLLASPLVTLAAASVAVKIIISTIKYLTPTIGEPSALTPLSLRLLAVGLGIAAAFIMKVGIFAAPADTVPALLIVNYILGGIAVGGGALGVHEMQNLIAPKQS